jgi:hypothetical protein
MNEAYYSDPVTFDYPAKRGCPSCLDPIQAGEPIRIHIFRENGKARAIPYCQKCADQAEQGMDARWTPSDEQRELDDRMNYALGFAPYKQPTK